MENVEKLNHRVIHSYMTKLLSFGGVFSFVAVLGIVTANISRHMVLWQLSVVILLVLLAVFIQVVKPAFFMPYLIMVWAFCPEIRRILDWSFHTYSDTPILSLAPLCVNLTLLLPIIKNFKHVDPYLRKIGAVFLAIIVYGFINGCIRYGLTAALYDGINYTAPFLILIYVHISAQEPAIRDRWLKWFSFVAVIVGLYGIYQYLYISPWDQFWMIHSEMTSIGQPEPLKVRVFSTLNSPGPTGVFLAYALAIMMMQKKWRVFGMPGVLIVAFTLLITLVRSSWITFVVMMLAYFMKAKSANKIRLLTIVAILIVGYQFILPNIPGAQSITARVQSFSSLNEDTSYNERLNFSTEILSSIISNPLGNGLGSTGLSAKLNNSSIQSFDNGFLNLFYTFGLLGGLAFIGLILSFIVVIRRRNQQDVEFSLLGFATVISVFVQLLSSNIFPGFGGVIIWFILSLLFLQKIKAKEGIP